MPSVSQKQKNAKKSFELSEVNREILTELVTILEWFELVNDEFQTNKVSISRVYPCVEALRHKLSESNIGTSQFIHTIIFCSKLLESLEKRFGLMIDNDVYVISTFLDPNFGIDVFPECKRSAIKRKIRDLLFAVQESESTKPANEGAKVQSRFHALRKSFYVYHNKTPSNNVNNLEKADNVIEKYYILRCY